MGKAYGYLLTNVDVKELLRRVETLKALGIAEEDLFSDDGGNKKAPGLGELLAKLRKGDTLTVWSVQCLGYGLSDIADTWETVTKRIGADIVVLDMPLMDTRKSAFAGSGMSTSDAVLQMIRYLAEATKATAKQRQAKGIADAHERGVHFGRMAIERPANFEQVLADYNAGKIKRPEAARLLGVSEGTFYQWNREMRDANE